MSSSLDLNLLNTLVAIAETGSLSAAALRLYRSQSAISEQVKKLEEICGLSLLERSKTGTKLTPAGKRVLEHAKRLLSLSDAAYRDIRGMQLTGGLRLAITDYFRPNTLPGILIRIRNAFPHLHLSVSIRESASIEQDGDFDIGLSMTILSDDAQNNRKQDGRQRLYHEQLSWVASPLFTPLDNEILSLVVLPDTCSLQRFAIRKLKESGVPYRIVHSASGVSGLNLALQAGLGVSCLNMSAIPDGVVPFVGESKLPILPCVEFSLVPPRYDETPFITDVRAMLAEQLANI